MSYQQEIVGGYFFGAPCICTVSHVGDTAVAQRQSMVISPPTREEVMRRLTSVSVSACELVLYFFCVVFFYVVFPSIIMPSSPKRGLVCKDSFRIDI